MQFAIDGGAHHDGSDGSRLHLAIVVDMFSRQVVGWFIGSRIDTTLVLDALLMALWLRQPQDAVTVNSDQGCQFTGHGWERFLRDHNLVNSMSRRRQIHPTRSEARADMFNYIEMFYNHKRRHGTAGNTSPVKFERRHSQRLTGV